MDKLNIANLLKDCPSGMELDCTMYEDVTFLDIDIKSNSYLIRIMTPCGIKYLDKYGCYTTSDKAKCVIFPKGKTTWEGFHRPFKDGDVVVDSSGAIFLYKRIHPYYEEQYADFYCGLTSEFKSFVIKTGEAQRCGKINYIRLATEEEKHELFDAIKADGYKWNAETKTLEKLIKPKFKVGDIIKETFSEKHKYTIINITDEVYVVKEENKHTLYINLENECFYELAPNKFDITTLKPFDKVLVRDNYNEPWNINYFSYIDSVKMFKTIMGTYLQCIPYEGNEYLLGLADKCDNYYKTW